LLAIHISFIAATRWEAILSGLYNLLNQLSLYSKIEAYDYQGFRRFSKKFLGMGTSIFGVGYEYL